MKIVYCAGFDYYPYAPKFMGIKQAMKELGWEGYTVDPIVGESAEAVAAEINAHNPDIVIYGTTVPFSRQICRFVDSHIQRVFWMLDYVPKHKMQELFDSGWLVNASYLDALFVCSEDYVAFWGDAFGLPTYFAPQACYVPSKLEYSKDAEFDLLFIGALNWNYPFNARAELLTKIRDLSPIPITHINESERNKRNEVFRKIPKYYHSSKLVLDISHFWTNWGYTSSRFWHAAAFGACNIVKRFPGCSDFFPEPLKYYFDTPQEAVDLIAKLSIDEALRMQTKLDVAEYGWRNHSWSIRLEKMLRCLETGRQVSMC
jgi:hypothetical protein